MEGHHTLTLQYLSPNLEPRSLAPPLVGEAKTSQGKKGCFHNRPYQDEDPRNFVSLGTQYFGGEYAFKCKYCGKIETMSLFTEEGEKFMKEYDELAKEL